MNDKQIPQGSNSDEREKVRRQLMAILVKNKIDDESRHDLVFAWTNGRTSSSRDLELQEMRDLVWKFQNHIDRAVVDLYLESERKKLRSQVLKIATGVGIKEPNDFNRFNQFMLNRSILKKELHKYSITELHDLVKQFRGIERNQHESAEKAGTKAWFHAAGIPAPGVQ